MGAAAAASAALAGLVFVGASINLKELMSYVGGPNRALEAIVLLSMVLLESMLVLAPTQPLWVLGLELLVVAAAAWVTVLMIHAQAYRVYPTQLRGQLVVRIAFGEAAVLPFVVAGFMLLIHAGGGLYWLLPGVIVANAAGLYNAWVLLIEILR